MKRKNLRSKFLGYTLSAIVFAVVLNIISLFIIYNMSVRLDDGASILRNYYIIMIIFWIVFIVISILISKSMRKIEPPINMASEQALRMSQGKAIVRSFHNENNELGDLTFSINALLEYILSRVEILNRINSGDYSFDIAPLGDTDKLTKAIKSMLDTTNDILMEIVDAARGINDVTSRISIGAEHLSSGSTEQAATIEQFSAVMNEVQSMADRTAEIAQNTRVGALSSQELMARSKGDFDRMIEAMDSITMASHRIETVIKVIDEIAFQTNILALNAAIEAARAGVHGKGFAVVADEVRELASKSAAAARETSELIQLSIESVQEGDALVRQTANSIKQLGDEAANAVENMRLLAESSENQRQSISDINNGINQISNVIQSNSIMAQENAMSAQQMAAQSNLLEHLVSKFKLRDRKPSDNALS